MSPFFKVTETVHCGGVNVGAVPVLENPTQLAQYDIRGAMRSCAVDYD
jgi:hypothetical protein